MSNVVENELKSVQKDLKNSIKKLTGELMKRDGEIEYYGYGDSWRAPEVMRRDMMRWELERQKRELVVLDWLIEMNKSLYLEVDGDMGSTGYKIPQSYWDIAVNWQKSPTQNASDYTYVEGVGAVKL